MTRDSRRRRRLATHHAFVRTWMPPAPARVLEIGCGALGGLVPALAADGHDVIGTDPEAPEGREYRRLVVEEYEPPNPVEVVVACTSLHHVVDLDRVLDICAGLLVPGGVMIAIEWAREEFDEPTARWCFDRLPPPEDAEEHDWLRHHQRAWEESGLPWQEYLAGWAAATGLHAGSDVVLRLRVRFDTRVLERTPYVFAELDHVSEQDEQAAIDAGLIRPTGLRYVGRRR